MNQMSSFAFPDASPEAELRPEPRLVQSFRIRRAGQRPLAFEGSELCMAMSYIPGACFWYETNIYRTTAQRFVVAIRLFFKSEDERDRVRAWEFESFEQVLACLERYDASEDVRVERFPDETGTAAAELAAHAFALQSRIADARAQFAGLVGEILYELESGA
jgi:hypothetical protein